METNEIYKKGIDDFEKYFKLNKGMSQETQFKIDKLYEKARNSQNSYEKQIYFRKIKLLEKGYCPTCERKNKLL